MPKPRPERQFGFVEAESSAAASHPMRGNGPTDHGRRRVSDFSSSCCKAPETRIERLRIVRDVVSAEAAALRRLAAELDSAAVEAAERIAACTGSVIVTGIGKAGWVGQKFVATLGSTGNRAHFLHPAEAIHGDLGRVGGDDLVLAISNSGRSEEVLRIVPLLRQRCAGLIALTSNRQNPLAAAADLTVTLGEHGEADPLGLAPTTSSTVMMAVGDAIAMLAARLVGFRAEDFGRLHPGGSLGHRLAPVDSMMRRLAECRTADESVTVREAMVTTAKTGRRSGAVMLLDRLGRVSGLFTDSDLARLLESRCDAKLDRPIREVMTGEFRRVRSGTKLIDAVDILKACRISELPVVDSEGRPLGMLDVTDIVAASAVEADSESVAKPGEPIKFPARSATVPKRSPKWTDCGSDESQPRRRAS